MRKGWFGPKVLGWGVGPRSWEGWLATVLFVAAAVASQTLLPEGSAEAWTAFVGVVAAFLLVVILTYRSDRA